METTINISHTKCKYDIKFWLVLTLYYKNVNAIFLNKEKNLLLKYIYNRFGYSMKAKNTNKKLSLFDKIIFALNIVTACLLLLSYFAPSTDPRDSTFIALLGFGYIYLVLANILFICYWPFRKPVFVLISFLAVLAGFDTFFKYVEFHKEQNITSKRSTTDLRIMQYNVRIFEGIDRFENLPTQNEIVKVVIGVHPDIVTMVEFKKSKLNRDSLKNTLNSSLNLKYNYFKSFFLEKGDSTGNAIFSKYPIIASGTVDTASLLQTKAIFADILYKGQKFRIYSLHLAAVTINEKQKKRYLEGQFGFQKFFFLIDRVSAAFISRSYQVDRIKRHIESCPYPYIITGDFNDTPNSFSVNELGDGLQNAFVSKGAGFQTTYYSNFPLQIDYILASQHFKILNYHAIDKKISDHKAIFSDLTFEH